MLFAVSLGVLWKLVQSVSWAEVRSAIAAATAEQLGLAFLFVGVSYLFLTGYDALALRQLKIKVPYRITALASFTSYAVSFTLGFPLLTGDRRQRLAAQLVQQQPGAAGAPAGEPAA